MLPRTLADTAVVGALAGEMVASLARFQRAEAQAAEAWAETVVLHSRLLSLPQEDDPETEAAGIEEAKKLEVLRLYLLRRQVALIEQFLEETAA